MTPSALDLLVFVGIAVVMSVAGIRLGMLAARRLDRMTQPSEEDDRGDDD